MSSLLVPDEVRAQPTVIMIPWIFHVVMALKVITAQISSAKIYQRSERQEDL